MALSGSSRRNLSDRTGAVGLTSAFSIFQPEPDSQQTAPNGTYGAGGRPLASSAKHDDKSFVLPLQVCAYVGLSRRVVQSGQTFTLPGESFFQVRDPIRLLRRRIKCQLTWRTIAREPSIKIRSSRRFSHERRNLLQGLYCDVFQAGAQAAGDGWPKLLRLVRLC